MRIPFGLPFRKHLSSKLIEGGGGNIKDESIFKCFALKLNSVSSNTLDKPSAFFLQNENYVIHIIRSTQLIKKNVLMSDNHQSINNIRRLLNHKSLLVSLKKFGKC